MICFRCESPVDEQALLCPQCGNALIEQKSKGQLAREANEARGGSKGGLAMWGLVLFVAVVTASALFAASGLLGGGNPVILLVALGVVVGLAAVAIPVGLGLGYLIYRMRTRRSRPRARSAEADSNR